MITIIGAGAIGGVIGGYLAKGGRQVEFVDIDKEHVEKMNAKGLTIELPDSSFTVPVNAYNMDEFLRLGDPLDKVYLCVKAQHTKDTVKSFKHLLQNTSYVVSFQNGLNELAIAEQIGKERTVGCFVNLFADYLEPGKVNYGGKGSVYIGELTGEITPRIKDLHQDLMAWGEAQITDNIFGYLWGKLGYAAILMATALTNETIADVLDNKEHQTMLFDLAAEVLAVADAKGIKAMGFDDWNTAWAYPVEKRDWAMITKEVAIHVARLRSYTKTRTGIWRDIAVRKRKTEVVEQMTPIVKEAKLLDICVPMLECLVSMFADIDEGKRELSLKNLEILHKVHKEKLAQK